MIFERSFTVRIRRLVMAGLAATFVAGGAWAPSADAATRVDFKVAGVRIWSNHTSNSTVVGLGYPGQKYDVTEVYGGNANESYICANGVKTWTWLKGRDVATGVAGYVPHCNTTW